MDFLGLTILGLLGCNGQSHPEKTSTVNRYINMIQIEDDNHPDGVFWIDQYEFPNLKGQKPRAYTSITQAKSGCAEVGKRLCTAAEWRRSCQGPNNYRFSYGSKYERGRCHTAGRLPSGHSSLMDPSDLIIASGNRESCQSTEGVFDMVGNLEEWVLDSWRGAEGMLEGGAWYTHTSYADCSGRYSRQPDYRIPTDRRVFSAGFRCCLSETEPTDAQLEANAQAFIQQSDVHDKSLPYDSENEIALGKGHYIDRFEYPNVAGAMPLSVASWETANQYCTDAGKRLCEAAEWEKACNGSTDWPYPYGKKYIPSSCAVERQNRSESGKYLGCSSPSGAQDMVGSVWEWTATPLNAPVLRVKGSTATWYELRGGSWFSDSRKATCLPDDGYPAAPTGFSFPEVGFRCCRGDIPDNANMTQTGTIECPNDMVSIDSFCVDRYEYPNRKDIEPLMDLSYTTAMERCKDAGKHLCSGQEWMRACGGSELRRWPYGNTYDVDACHDLGSQTVEGGGGTVPSGSMPSCCTPEGVCDMSGNLWEWTGGEPGAKSGIMRGGGWNLSAGLGQCRAKAKAQADYHAGETGARCCATAEEVALLKEAQ
ncbi:MAG: SUMF1/EgtB/PvdO family nonheme iron enzyme [Myxococcota bacterium]|nr:SUMF1/EgtB/PvdO family nonheme iron enzyme [Myxococcota bacterium]